MSDSCDPMDCTLPGSSVHGILQAIILEWVTVSFSRGIIPNSGIKSWSPVFQADSLLTKLLGKPLSFAISQKFAQIHGHQVSDAT